MYLVLATYLPSTHRAKVAFLFAFRNFYQRCLLLPAAAGLLLSLSQRCFTRGPALVQPLYGLAISLWGSVVLRAWRRQRCQLAALWGVDGAHETEVVRVDFRGERLVSRVTGEATLYYPAWKRALKRCVTVPILAAQLLLLTGIIVMLYLAWLSISASQHNRAVKTLLVVLLSVLWSVLVYIYICVCVSVLWSVLVEPPRLEYANCYYYLLPATYPLPTTCYYLLLPATTTYYLLTTC